MSTVVPIEAAPATLSPQARREVDEALSHYPNKRSAILPVLWVLQREHGWISPERLKLAASLVELPEPEVFGIATFYTMFNLEPVGQFHVQLCGTTPCMLRGSEQLKEVCRRRIGEQHHITADGKFSWIEVECLAACVNAPMVQINADYYEDLTPESFERILNELASGRTPKSGPQIGRQFSAPLGPQTTLTDPELYKGANGASAGAALTDEDAKKPGAPANVHEAAVPKPPATDGSRQ